MDESKQVFLKRANLVIGIAGMELANNQKSSYGEKVGISATLRVIIAQTELARNSVLQLDEMSEKDFEELLSNLNKIIADFSLLLLTLQRKVK